MERDFLVVKNSEWTRKGDNRSRDTNIDYFAVYEPQQLKN